VSPLHPVLGLAVVAADAWLGYGRFMLVANRMARRVVDRIPPRDIPFLHGLGIAVMPSWLVLQAGVYLLLAVPLGLPVATLFRFEPSLVVRGVLLGVGEASCSMLLAQVAFRALAPVRQVQSGGDPALEYQTLGQSGWMRTYLYVFARLPLPLALLVVSCPLLGEELIFRATAIPLLAPLGVVPAVALSTLVFSAVQVKWLPSWYQAIGPVCGAAVMGLANGLVFAGSGNLLPALIAHVTFLGMLIDPSRLRDDQG
jgi:hypothetical protein